MGFRKTDFPIKLVYLKVSLLFNNTESLLLMYISSLTSVLFKDHTCHSRNVFDSQLLEEQRHKLPLYSVQSLPDFEKDYETILIVE